MSVTTTPSTGSATAAGAPGMSIAIVGAGIGGLSLAVTLQRNGFRDVRVFERSRALTSRGGTVRLDQASQRALAKMGLEQAVNGVAIKMSGFDRFSNGRLINRFEPSMISISREALQKILAGTVAPGTVRMGQPVTAVRRTERVALEFADGSSEAFDLVVGADGINSTVSAQCFPKETEDKFTGYVVYYCIAKGTFVPEPVFSEHFISKGRLGFRMVTVPGGGSDGRWDSLQITIRGEPCSSARDAEGEVDEMLAYLDIAGANCLPGSRDIVANADRIFKWGMYQSPRMATWTAGGGRVVLLGDAAHAMAPFTGQGASTSIVDGLTLGDLLAVEPVPVALAAYEKARKPVCEEAIRRSYTRGLRITSHGFSRWYTDTAMRLMVWASRRPLLRRIVKIQTFTDTGASIFEWVDRAIDLFRRDGAGAPAPRAD
jgi:2-polyprenyl-6-methoxyphenol hydroxylase-like FAD-dependent oxidoreductase